MTPFLAAGAGVELGPIVLAGIVLLLKFLFSGTSKNLEPKAPPMPRERPPQPPRVTTDEEERTRKFLEALGLPPTAMAPTPPPPPLPGQREKPTSMRQYEPAPRRGAEIPPIPPFLPQEGRPGVPTVRREKKKKHAEAPPAPVAPYREPTLNLPPDATVSGRVENPKLDTPKYHEFRTRASEVTAIPFDRRPGEQAGESSRAERRASAIRALLREKDSVRNAVVLREILGPPPGLQSPGGAPSFPSP